MIMQIIWGTQISANIVDSCILGLGYGRRSPGRIFPVIVSEPGGSGAGDFGGKAAVRRCRASRIRPSPVLDYFNGAEYLIRRKLERQCVVTTLSTHHRRVFIEHEGKLIKSAPFPFVGCVVEPLR